MISRFVIRLRKLSSHLPYLPRAMRLVWSAAPGWTAAWVILLVVQGLLPVMVVYLTKSLVDSLVAAVGKGMVWQEVRPVFILAVLMGAILLLMDVLRSGVGWVRTALSEVVQDDIMGIIHEKSTSLDLVFYESPDFYDHLHRARAEARYRPLTLMENIGHFLQNGVTLVAMAAVLTRFGLWLPMVLIISTLPALVVVLRHNLYQHEWRMRTTADNRRCWYYDWLLASRESAAEMRLFGLGDHFRSAYRNIRERLRKERLQLAKDEAVAELGARAAALCITFAALAWMVRRALLGTVTLGDLALFYQALQQGQQMMRSLLGNVGQIYSNLLFLGNLFEFLSLEPGLKEANPSCPVPQVLEEGIRFHQIRFRYPGSERFALDNFDLWIPARQVVALVGTNGAGKSTLVKLICRLYDAESGSIELDGTDIKKMPIEELRRLVSALFQDPVHYNATVADNIVLSDLMMQGYMKEIETAACAAGADDIITGLPRGYETLLGRWFEGGTELSAGQWQRVALARAFLREAPIIVLDEPTSAMDSWAEAEWFERFRILTEGRTVILITHRFTTAMRADVIHVMDGGRIVESGSHSELLGLGGRYAQSWKKQTGSKQDADKR